MKVTMKCLVCSEEFQCPKSEAKRRKYCSRDCYAAVLRTMIGEKNNRYGTKHTDETRARMSYAQSTMRERWGR